MFEIYNSSYSIVGCSDGDYIYDGIYSLNRKGCIRGNEIYTTSFSSVGCLRGEEVYNTSFTRVGIVRNGEIYNTSGSRIGFYQGNSSIGAAALLLGLL